MKEELLFCPLGGSGEIGMNMNLFGYGPPGEHKWIMVDIGVTFADDTIPGVDLIYPDPGFIVERKENLLGIKVALSESVLRDNFIPGAIIPPKYSFLIKTSNVVAVPKSSMM